MAKKKKENDRRKGESSREYKARKSGGKLDYKSGKISYAKKSSPVKKSTPSFQARTNEGGLPIASSSSNVNQREYATKMGWDKPEVRTTAELRGKQLESERGGQAESKVIARDVPKSNFLSKISQALRSKTQEELQKGKVGLDYATKIGLEGFKAQNRLKEKTADFFSRLQGDMPKVGAGKNIEYEGSVPITEAIKQRSFKPLYQQFTTPEGRSQFFSNVGKIDPMNVFGEGVMSRLATKPGNIAREGLESTLSKARPSFNEIKAKSANTEQVRQFETMMAEKNLVDKREIQAVQKLKQDAKDALSFEDFKMKYPETDEERLKQVFLDSRKSFWGSLTPRFGMTTEDVSQKLPKESNPLIQEARKYKKWQDIPDRVDSGEG